MRPSRPPRGGGETLGVAKRARRPPVAAALGFPPSSIQRRLTAMNDELFERGLAIRKSVLGAEYVEKSIGGADDFTMPLQRLVTEYCWGAVWGREELPKKTRSLLNIALLGTLNRHHELKVHVKGAIRNGC